MIGAPGGGAATVALPAEKQILITREFRAPREHVFRAWTEPELVRRWWPARPERLGPSDTARLVRAAARWPGRRRPAARYPLRSR